MSLVTRNLTLKSDGSANDATDHILTVVATDSSTDRDDERFDTASLKLPLKNGGTIEASKAGKGDELDIPAFINHERDVRKMIGSVDSAFIDSNGQLEMNIRLASGLDDAETVYKLASGGHLGNNVSVTYDMADTTEESGVYYGATVLEVSVVWRGANKNARILSVKSDKEKEEMAIKTKTPAEVADALGQAKDALTSAMDAVSAAEQANDDGQKPDDKPSAKPANPSEQEPGANNSDNTSKEDNVNVTKAMCEATKSTKAPESVKAKSLVANEYLKSKKATADWFSNIAKHSNDPRGAADAWKANLTDKGITGDDILPTEISQIFIDNFENPAGVLSTVKRMNVKQMVVNALTGTGDEARAAGHRKGDIKRNQKLANKRRSILCHMIYKKLDLNQIDVWTTPELARERLGELTKQLANEIERAIVIGDGRAEPADGQPDLRVFVDGEGILSIKSDVKDSADENKFGSRVADIYTPTADDANLYDEILGAKSLIKADGKLVLVAKKSAITSLYRMKNQNGGYLIQPSATPEATLGVDKVITPSWMEEDDEFNAYLYVDGSYTLIGDSTPTQRPFFDVNTNSDVLLLEEPNGGSLSGYKVAVGIQAVEQS